MSKFKLLPLAAITIMLMSCGGDKKTDENTDTIATTKTSTETAPAAATTAQVEKYDPNRGLGKHEDIDISKFDPAMAAAGKKIVDVKCTTCHKMTDEKLVGPGWKDITKRHPAGWIMNFITNPDPMIDVDPELKKQLQLCLVRMPDQSLDDTQAREIVEFMRQNDGAK